MGSHIAPGAETSRQQVEAKLAAATAAAVQSALNAGIDDEVATAVSEAVSAAITQEVLNAVFAAWAADNPLAALQQTSELEAADELNAKKLYVGDYPAKYPSESQWPYTLTVKARADSDGNLIPLLFKRQLAEIPETPDPVTPLEGAGLDTSWQAFKAEYVAADGSIPADGSVSLNSVARALQQAVLQTDQATYDLVLGWARTERRISYVKVGKYVRLERSALDALVDAGRIHSQR